MSQTQAVFTSYPMTEVLSTAVEAPSAQGTYYANVFSGYFKAPASANYKFYSSCDDRCSVSLSTSADPTQKTVIINNAGFFGWRNYFASPSTQNSTQIPLVQDQYYYFEVQTFQYTGGDYATVGVEIEQSAIANHYNAKKEIQQLQINPTNVREQTVFTVNNPDSGTYTLTFFNPTTKTYVTTDPIAANASSTNFGNAVAAFYGYYGSVSVVRTMYDTNGVVTTTLASATKLVYTLSLLKSITGYSTNSIKPTLKTSAQVSVQLPQ